MSMSFLKVYFDFEERTEMLNEVEQGRLLLTMLRYAQGKTLPELKGNERFLFPVFKSDIDRDQDAYNAKVSNGAKGGRPRQKTENNLTKPNETEDNLNLKNKNKNKNKNKKEEQEQEYIISFDRFWAVYPRKDAKQDALKAWKSLNPNEELQEAIIADVQRRMEPNGAWYKTEKKYIKLAGGYLRSERWKDEGGESERAIATGSPGPVILTPEEEAIIDEINRRGENFG